jgi:vacuolar protein sorting-associated protein 52
MKTVTKIRTHFLSLLQPIRTSLTTNLQILQSSLFLNKYLPLYRFLQRNAAATAEEIKVGYINCAKQYYETGMRRYTRSLGWIRVNSHLCYPFFPMVTLKYRYLLRSERLKYQL